MKTKKNRKLAIIMVVAMLVSLIPVMAFADEHDPIPNYAFIPNSGEASVSKVDLVSMVEVARYYTAPRVGDFVDFEGNETLIGNTVAPLSWRTSRIAMDEDGNAYVLNVGSDALGLTGSVARIQANTTDLTTATDATPLAFGTDEAVQILTVGNSQEMPRAIVIDGDGYIWIGFYGSGRLVKYEYNPVVPSLDIVEEWSSPGIGFYEMKLHPNKSLFISSRQSTSSPARPGIVEGIYRFTGTGFVRETTFSPYALLIDPDGTVYATGYSNLLHIRNADTTAWSSVAITGSSQNRGMAFDGLGKIWIASTTNHNAGTVVYSYVIATGLPGPTYTLISGGTTPVGLGRDEAGLMWAICRTDGRTDGGFIEAFDPTDASFAGSVQVGYRPYAYGEFVVPPPPTYCICGYKLDADTELGLGGWTINLYKWNVDLEDWEWIDDTLTAVDDGKYCFEGLLAGEYKVSEVLEDGWEQISPTDNEHVVDLPVDASDCEAILGDDEALFYNFVNAKLYEIDGYKYLSGTDKGLEGWLITLEKDVDGEWEEVSTTTTDEFGYYKFVGLLAGDYRVSETLKPGWTQTYPLLGVHEFTLPYEGELESFDFHNLPELTCSDETVWAADGAPGIDRFVEQGNWATYVGYTMGTGSLNTPITYPLYAGQTHLAGMIEVYDEGGSIFVRYMIFGDDDEYKDGYCGEWTALTEYHLQVVDEFEGFNPYRTFNKRTGYGTPIPGSFDLKMGWSKDEAVSDTGWIEVEGDFSDTVYIAAHGVAWWCGYECEPYDIAEVLGMSLLSR
ncbi:MAG: hypothetical protein KMY55_06075 [Dethiosulfatibacter sp.]|nr:hypothetical protein [Dethiosulfatibacter sp.]